MCRGGEDAWGGQCYGNLLINPAQQSWLAKPWAGCHTWIRVPVELHGRESGRLGFAAARASGFLRYVGSLTTTQAVSCFFVASFFSSSSAEKLDLNKSWLTFSRASFSQGCVAAAAVLQSEGTTGGDSCTLSTPASHLWDLITPHIGARPLLFINHIINV